MKKETLHNVKKTPNMEQNSSRREKKNCPRKTFTSQHRSNKQRQTNPVTKNVFGKIQHITPIIQVKAKTQLHLTKTPTHPYHTIMPSLKKKLLILLLFMCLNTLPKQKHPIKNVDNIIPDPITQTELEFMSRAMPTTSTDDGEGQKRYLLPEDNNFVQVRDGHPDTTEKRARDVN